MRRQGLVARIVKRRRGLTVQDKNAPKFPDLLKRDLTECAPNTRWCGDIKCRRRHLKSYADLGTMPTIRAIAQVNGDAAVRKVGIVA